MGDRGDTCKPSQIVTILAEETPREVYTYVDEPTTVKELSRELDIPLTTAYRTVDRLEEAGLLTEHEQSGSPTEYVKTSEQVIVRYTDPLEVTCLKGGLLLYCEV